MQHLLSGLWGQVGPILSLVLGAAIVHRIKTPGDQERAQLLSQIANDAAALVVTSNPNAPFAQLLQQLVSQISQVSALPTGNGDAIRRAAAAALAAHGVKPTG